MNISVNQQQLGFGMSTIGIIHKKKFVKNKTAEEVEKIAKFIKERASKDGLNIFIDIDGTVNDAKLSAWVNASKSSSTFLNRFLIFFKEHGYVSVNYDKDNPENSMEILIRKAFNEIRNLQSEKTKLLKK